jgi:hypothetical protein
MQPVKLIFYCQGGTLVPNILEKGGRIGGESSLLGLALEARVSLALCSVDQAASF